MQEIDFGGAQFGLRGGSVLPNHVKIFSSKMSTDIKKHWHLKLSR